MKRSRHINLQRLRKASAAPSWRRHPLWLAVASAVGLSGCGGQDVVVYTNVGECTDDYPGFDAECQLAYQRALREAARSAPKYRKLGDCEYDFGHDICLQDGSNRWYPKPAGFLLDSSPMDWDDDDDGGRRYHSSPIYTSYSYSSPYRNQWVTADGRRYGSASKRKVSVSSSAFKPQPKVTKTISRGGFGSTAAAKSSWGSSSRSGGGWGG